MIINPYIFDTAPPANLLIDDFPAHAAYSVRLLSNSYSGALVRVRRSSDSAEKDFYPDGSDELSMSSEDGAGTSLSTWISTDSGYITDWYDQSGNGYDVSNTNAASQFRLVNAGTLDTKGGKAKLYSSGAKYLTRTGLTALAHSNNNTVSAVANLDNTSTFRTIFTTYSNNTTNVYCMSIDPRTQKRNSFVFNSGGTQYYADLSAQRNNQDQRLQISILDSSKNMSAFDNSATGGTNTYTGTYLNTIFQLGLRGSTGLVGGIQEVIVWSDAKGSSDRGDIETDINTYYSIW